MGSSRNFIGQWANTDGWNCHKSLDNGVEAWTHEGDRVEFTLVKMSHINSSLRFWTKLPVLIWRLYITHSKRNAPLERKHAEPNPPTNINIDIWFGYSDNLGAINQETIRPANNKNVCTQRPTLSKGRM